MRFRLSALPVYCALLFFISVVDGYGQQLPSFTIGIVTDGPIINRPETVSIFKQEIVNIAEEEFSVSFPENLTREADNTVAGINRELDFLLDNEETDLILALGTVATAEALKRRNLTKPVLGSLVMDANLLQAPRLDGGSGVTNLTYLDIQTPIGRGVAAFRKLVSFKSLGLLIDERDIQGAPGIARLVRDLANEYTMSVQLIPVRESADDALAGISPDMDAVIVGPLWRVSDDEFSRLSKGLIERKLPSFAMWDKRYVEQGVFAGNMPTNLLEHVARRISVTVQEILLGEDAASIPVAFSRSDRLSINMATARAIDVYPGLAIMTGAELFMKSGKTSPVVSTLPWQSRKA